MFSPIRDLISIATPLDRRGFMLLLPIIVLSALMQVFGIASITPFLAVVAEPELALANPQLAAVYNGLGFEETTPFLIFLGVGALVLLLLSAGVGALNTHLISRYAALVRFRWEMRLLERYMASPYERFLSEASSDLGKNVLAEVREVVESLLRPALNLVTRFVVIVAIVGLMLFVDVFLALTVLFAIGGAYLSVFQVIRRRLERIGSERVRVDSERFTGINQALSGIKAIRVNQRESFYLEGFRDASQTYADLDIVRRLIHSIPKHVLEILAFGAILTIVIYLLATGGGLSRVLPVLGLYAFASYRLMPAGQVVFESIARIRYGGPAIEILRRELGPDASPVGASGAASPLPLRSSIEFRGVTYRYPEADGPAVASVDLRIERGQHVAFIGETGSGKTTMVDLILGLFTPTSGEILIDGEPLDEGSIRSWQAGIGYVQQDTFIADATIADNISFSRSGEISHAAVRRAASVAQIDAFIEGLPDGYDASVGERGVKLSGGQRQRLGWARALYRDPQVLVFDEATSALDGLTEERLMHDVGVSMGDKTVITVAHRLATVRSCDTIFLMHEGRVVDAGSYEKLLVTSSTFRAMVDAQAIGAA